MWPPVPRLWPEETCFIVAGGPSVAAQNLELIRDRKVIAVNSSWKVVPWASVLFFHDQRWWNKYGKEAEAEFSGIIVTTNAGIRSRRVYKLRNSRPSKRPRPHPPHLLTLSTNPAAVPMRRTSLVPAMNIAAHLGVNRIVLLGADGKRADDGRCHHHAPHPWPVQQGCWDRHRIDLSGLVPGLEALGIEVLNASPGSAWDLWPVVTLEDALGDTMERSVKDERIRSSESSASADFKLPLRLMRRVHNAIPLEFIRHINVDGVLHASVGKPWPTFALFDKSYLDRSHKHLEVYKDEQGKDYVVINVANGVAKYRRIYTVDSFWICQIVDSKYREART